MTRAAALLVLTGAVALVQWQSILFWSAQVSAEIGWLWSVALEASGLWLWYQGRALTRALGVLASLLLLAGPLAEVAGPLLLHAELGRAADSARAKLIAEAEAALASAEAQLTAALDNSRAAPRWQRHEWIPAVRDAQQRADRARTALTELRRTPPAAPEALAWQTRATVALQALALVVLQLSGIIAITSLHCAPHVSASPAPRDPVPPELLPRPTRTPVRKPKRKALGPLGLVVGIGTGKKP